MGRGSLSRTAGEQAVSRCPAIWQLPRRPRPSPAVSVCLETGSWAGWGGKGQAAGTGVWEASVGRWSLQGWVDVWSE